MKAVAILLVVVGLAVLGLLAYPHLVIKKDMSAPQQFAPIPNTPPPTVFPSAVQVPRNPDGSFQFPANYVGWYPIGTGNITLKATGRINYGGEWATPEGSEIGRISRAEWNDLADRLPLAALVAKIGPNGQPFVVGALKTINAGSSTVFIGVNDSNYTDNTGAYTIQVQ